MSQLATIFEKIKEDFFANLSQGENKEQFKLIFAPFSTGFTADDFLFLDTNNASDQAHKYRDELYEFSQISNTIPKQDNFWTTSAHQNDYLFNKYKIIIQSLRLIDPDTITVEMLYEHQIFDLILNAIDEELATEYKSFYNLYINIKKEIEALKNADQSDVTTDIQLKNKEENLKTIEEQWSKSTNKVCVETKILAILKDEIKRFLLKLTETKANFEISKQTHLGSNTDFYLTYCMPNNLYKADDLSLKKIRIDKAEIERLLKKEGIKDYNTFFGSTDKDIDLEHIEFELIFVKVTRSWFEDSLLESPFWDINILDKNDIEIPNYTSQLIFIRKVDLKLEEDSTKNIRFLKIKTPKNLGPFVINPSLLQREKKLQLKSVNTGLNLKRETVFSVASKINSKTTVDKSLVLKKQNQFVKLSSKLQQKEIAKTKIKSVSNTKFGLKASRLFVKPKLVGILKKFNTVKYEFTFLDAKTKRQIFILPENISTIKNGKKVKSIFQKTSNGKLTTLLSLNSTYTIEIKKENYDLKRYKIKTGNYKRNNKFPVKLTIDIKKTKIKAEPIDNSLQLIGVISKKIKHFPNPIKNADYL